MLGARLVAALVVGALLAREPITLASVGALCAEHARADVDDLLAVWSNLPCSDPVARAMFTSLMHVGTEDLMAAVTLAAAALTWTGDPRWVHLADHGLAPSALRTGSVSTRASLNAMRA